MAARVPAAVRRAQSALRGRPRLPARLALRGRPHWSAVGHALAPPHIQTNSTYLLLFVATAGTTITPYMQLYLQSATVERGAREEDLANDQRQAVAGAIFADLVAAFIIIATGATLYGTASTRSTAPRTPPRRS